MAKGKEGGARKVRKTDPTAPSEIEKLQKDIQWLRAEAERLEGELRQANADRDNWRKQALNENARLEGVLERIRNFVDAQNEEDRIAKMNMDAFNAKREAFDALIKLGAIPVGTMPKGTPQ